MLSFLPFWCMQQLKSIMQMVCDECPNWVCECRDAINIQALGHLLLLNM